MFRSLPPQPVRQLAREWGADLLVPLADAPQSVFGGLPGEAVELLPHGRRRRDAHFSVLRVREPSPQRAEPLCAAFGVCGGCRLQHAAYVEQLRAKEGLLRSLLPPDAEFAPAIESRVSGYRARGRFAVRRGATGVEIGWRSRLRKPRLCNVDGCPVSDQRIASPAAMSALRHMVGRLSRPDLVPTLEFAAAENAVAVVIRHLSPLTRDDTRVICDAGRALPCIWFYSQSGGPDTLAPLWQGDEARAEAACETLLSEQHAAFDAAAAPRPMRPAVREVMQARASARTAAEAREREWVGAEEAAAREARLGPPLEYTLGVGGRRARLQHQPLDFAQVNRGVNEAVVAAVCEALSPRAGDEIADLFCGIGNFAVSLAAHAAAASPRIFGVDVAREAVAQAAANAQLNGLAGLRFGERDLFKRPQLAEGAKPNKAVLNPPRPGARELLESKWMAEASELRQLAYLSCNPVTLARDTLILRQRLGFRLRSARLVDMFAHTAHVEALCVFER
jgi:23S rRNA (uracil1939-C5)-methyltransferase